jgi:hypothetical protein
LRSVRRSSDVREGDRRQRFVRFMRIESGRRISAPAARQRTVLRASSTLAATGERASDRMAGGHLYFFFFFFFFLGSMSVLTADRPGPDDDTPNFEGAGGGRSALFGSELVVEVGGGATSGSMQRSHAGRLSRGLSGEEVAVCIARSGR